MQLPPESRAPSMSQAVSGSIPSPYAMAPLFVPLTPFENYVK